MLKTGKIVKCAAGVIVSKTVRRYRIIAALQSLETKNRRYLVKRLLPFSTMPKYGFITEGFGWGNGEDMTYFLRTESQGVSDLWTF